MMGMQASPGARSPVSRGIRNAILLAAVIEALAVIPTLLYLVFGNGR
jgi:hypothetical protein